MKRVMIPAQKAGNTPLRKGQQKLPTLIPSSDKEALAILQACISPVCFWPPEHVPAHSAWLEHAPFGFWLIEVLRPRTLVELGTHRGFSYFAFCQAVLRLQLETCCYAVDTWKGDEHAGFYGEEVFREVCNRNDLQYSAFSTLIRSTFDEASRHFSDATIDLLHIDGRHFYDDVKHDFETWLAKLSDRAIVLMHDINIRERDFGVFKLWKELCRAHPHFEFAHGHGLGILGIGKELPDQILALFAAGENAQASTDIRRAYSRLGAAVSFQSRVEQLQLAAESQVAGLRGALAERDARLAALDQTLSGCNSELGNLRGAFAEREARLAALDRTLSERNSELGNLRGAFAERGARLAALHQTLSERNSELGNLRGALAERDARLTALDQTLSERNSELSGLWSALAESRAQISSLQSTISALHASTSWRITSPLRSAKRRLWRLRYSTAGYPLALGWRALKTRSLAPLRDWRTTRVIARSGWFEMKWYLRNNPDVAEWGIDPIRHYVDYGAREGRDPSPSFSTRGYLSHNPDVAAAGVNPLEHFICYGAKEGRVGGSSRSSAAHPEGQIVLPSPTASPQGSSGLSCSLEWGVREREGPAERYYSGEAFEADCKLLRESGLFDLDAYRTFAGIDADIDAVGHYLVEGWRAGLEPGPGFEGEFLYSYFRSVGHSGPPAVTHLKLRAAGGPAYATLADAEHWAAPVRESDLFDAAGYAARLDHLDGLDPALHYVIVGERMGLAPSEAFDPNYYRQRYPDIAKAAVNALGHYLTIGRQEGRRPASIATKLPFDRSRIDERRETILLISHEASRTGAPILAWNVAMRLSRQYNIVALLLSGGELIQDFENCCAAVIGPLSHADWHPVEAEHIVRSLLASYTIKYAIANSTESRLFVPALASAFVPVMSLIHEFASYTRPKGAMGEGLDWSTQIVFSADVTATSAVSEHPHLSNRSIHVIPQGRCDVPRGATKAVSTNVQILRGIFRPKGCEHALVVLGAGFVHIRKGVDLFLSCAAAVAALDPKRPVRFIWIGNGYDLVNDPGYSTYLGEQIARSGLEGKVAIIDAVEDLEPAYTMTDVFFLSSRLDPMPNVTIDAAFHELPVVCFENASGMATLLTAEPPLRCCVVPHLDVQAAARLISEFANDESARRSIGHATRRFAEVTFDMDSYVRRLDELGREAVDIMRQRAQDFITLRDDSLFDKNMFLPPGSMIMSREDAIRQFLARWAAVGMSRGPTTNYYFRRPCAGFHPQIYAHANSGCHDGTIVNPLAHFVRSGRPEGPWWHDVLTPPGNMPVKAAEVRTGLHVHFYYPELASDFLRKLHCNRSSCDLLLSTDTRAKAKALRIATSGYARGEVLIRVVPNRGRDIGPFLTAFNDILARYEVTGHLHSKRSLFALTTADPTLGERRREFLWQNLLGDLYPMMDIILHRFAADDKLGIVFAEDPTLSDWDNNLELASNVAKRMNLQESLPPFFDFPGGAMFWARPDALRPLLALDLGWEDYPEEPLPVDGTILHALERLLPFAARHAGYGFATTHVESVTW